MHSNGVGSCRQRLKVSKWLYAANPLALGFQTGWTAVKGCTCTVAVVIGRHDTRNNKQQRAVQALCEQ